MNDLSRSQHAIFQRQQMLCEHRVIVSLDSWPQILLESMSGIFIFKINLWHFPSLSLPFWKTLNKFFCCGQKHSYLISPWIWHFDLENSGRIIQLLISRLRHVCRWWHLCDWLRYKATSGLRGAKVWTYLCCWINFGRILSWISIW